jgi:hypothetical protein
VLDPIAKEVEALRGKANALPLASHIEGVVLPNMAGAYPDVGVERAGLHRERSELLGTMASSLLIAMVLTDATHRLRREGMALPTALQAAALERVLPILLTSLTTFLGLLPLLVEGSAQAGWLRPIAVALAFGVLFATAITRLLPAVTTLTADVSTAWARWADSLRSSPLPPPRTGLP